MTIKEFARLCGCNPQTLRYYDRMELLKQVKVDSWTGYRYYEDEQALDFVKIKNLQTAGFTIEEIRGLSDASNEEIYSAFEEKIKEA
jgi:DNA-binding transcriptional MerR regulator